MNESANPSDAPQLSEDSKNKYINVPIPVLILVPLCLLIIFTTSIFLFAKRSHTSSTKKMPITTTSQVSIVTPDIKKYSVIINAMNDDNFKEGLYSTDYSGKNERLLGSPKIKPLLQTETQSDVYNNSKRMIVVDGSKLVTFLLSDPSHVVTLYSMPKESSGYLKYPVLSTNGTKIAFAEDLIQLPAMDGSPGQQEMSNLYVVNIDGTGLKKVYSFSVPRGYLTPYAFNSEKNEIILSKQQLSDTSAQSQDVLSDPVKYQAYLRSIYTENPLGVVDASTGSTKKILTNLGKPYYNTDSYFFSNDPNIIFFTQNETNDSASLYKYMVTTNTAQLVYKFPPSTSTKKLLGAAVSHDGTELMMTYYTEDEDTLVYIVNLATSSVKKVAESRTYMFSPLDWSPDNNYVYAQNLKDYNSKSGYIIDRNGVITPFNPTILTSDNYDEFKYLGWGEE